MLSTIWWDAIWCYYEIFHSVTDIHQPLDMRIFGAMKSPGSKEFGEFVYFKWRGYTQAAADVFVKCWKSFTRDLINKSMNLYTEFSYSSDDDESDEDSSNDN